MSAAPELISGIDISNHQGLPANYRGQQWYRDANFVISQAIPRPRPAGIVSEQLHAAHDDGKYTGIYTWLWHDPSWRLSPDVREDQRARLACVATDTPVDMRPFLDLEDNVSTGWRNLSVEQRRAEVLTALATLTEWATQRGLPQAGVYWSRYYVNLLYGGDDSWLPPGTCQWLANYNLTAGALIGGSCVGHQYASLPIDLDVMLASEIVSKEIPTVRIPADYVTKFSLPDDQDVVGLISNLEGIITDLQSQIATDAADDVNTATTDVALQAKLAQIKAIVEAA